MSNYISSNCKIPNSEFSNLNISNCKSSNVQSSYLFFRKTSFQTIKVLGPNLLLRRTSFSANLLFSLLYLEANQKWVFEILPTRDLCRRGHFLANIWVMFGIFPGGVTKTSSPFVFWFAIVDVAKLVRLCGPQHTYNYIKDFVGEVSKNVLMFLALFAN